MSIYLDYAASTPLDPEVWEKMSECASWIGNPSSIHGYGRRLRAAIEDARAQIAQCLGASPSEIIFTSGGTEADNHAIRAAVENLELRTIIYNPTEHHAVLHTIEDLSQKKHIQAFPIHIYADGTVDLNHLESLLRQHKKILVCVMHANNEIGTIQPVHDIASLCQKYGALFHCDTVQTMGLGWVNVEKIPVDFAVASAHKFYGPKGVGFLYRRKPIGSFITGGAQERNQRAGTENVMGIVGMAYALSRAYQEKSTYESAMRQLKDYFVKRLVAHIPGVVFNGPAPQEGHPSILNVRFPLNESESILLMHLDLRGIAVSGTSACSSGAGHPSHVLQALGLTPIQAINSLRFSWGKGITTAMIDTVVQALQTIIAQLAAV